MTDPYLLSGHAPDGVPRPAPRPGRRRAPRCAPTCGRIVALLAVVAALLGTAVTVPSVAAASGPDPGIQGRAHRAVAVTHEVYGYLPYWRLDAGTVDRLDLSTVSTIAFFAVPIHRSGALDTDTPGFRAYVSEAAGAVTNAAHARGIRVVPTFQLFDHRALTTLRTFLGSGRAQ
ncbi:MAG: hypothetical protein ACHQNA_12560, partial [Acidimicrobiales bacterium]